MANLRNRRAGLDPLLPSRRYQVHGPRTNSIKDLSSFTSNLNRELGAITDKINKFPDIGRDFKPSDYVRLVDLESAINDLEETELSRVTPEGEAAAGTDGGRGRRARRRRRAIEAAVESAIQNAEATNAPPEVEDVGAVGTTDHTPGPTRFALEDHTHSGVNLSDAQSIGGIKSFQAIINLRTVTPTIPNTAIGTFTDLCAQWDESFALTATGGGLAPQFRAIVLNPTITSPTNVAQGIFFDVSATITQTVAPLNGMLVTALRSAILSQCSTNLAFPWNPDLMVDANVVDMIGNGVAGAIVGTTPGTYIYTGYLAIPTIRATLGATLTYTGVNSGIALFHAAGTLAATGATGSTLNVPYRAAVHDPGPTITTNNGGVVNLDRNASVYTRDHTAGTLQAAILSQLNTATGKWFLYGEGTAKSSMVGGLRIGDNTAPTEHLEVVTTMRGYAGNATISGVAQEVRAIDLNAAFTISGALGSFYGVHQRGTITDTGTGFLQVVKNTALVVRASAGANFSTVTILENRPTLRSDALAITGGAEVGMAHVPSYDRVNAGTIAGITDSAIETGMTVGAGCTIATRRGLRHQAATITGAITNDIAVDVGATVGGTLTAALRSAITSGTGKWCILDTGGADSSFAGRIFVGGTASTAPVVDMDIDGDLAVRSANVTLANGTNDDVAIGARSLIRITGPTGNFTTTSFASPQNGKVLIVINTTAQQWTIVDDAGTGTAANRIYTGDGANVVLAAGADTTETGRAMFIYDSGASRWQMIAARDTAGPR